MEGSKKRENKSLNDVNRMEFDLIRSLEQKSKRNTEELRLLRKEMAELSIKEGSFFISEFKKQTITLSVAAFAFLAALTWRDAISAWLAPLLQGRTAALEFTFVAILVTIIAIFTQVFLTRFLGHEEKK